MSQRTSGFERQSGDQYMTPEWVAKTLLSVMPIYGEVWEPSCGEGSISNTIKKLDCYVRVVATDICAKYSDDGFSRDFTDPQVLAAFVRADRPITIVTNPPYGHQGKLAERFVRLAIDITQFNHGRVAMLLPVDWDAAKTRHDLFEDFHGHVTKITLTDRIRWTNLPQSKSGPSQNHAWFIWDHSRRGREMRWLGRLNHEA